MLAMVLANIFKKVVGRVISSSQNVLVDGRQILDVTLVANEVVDSRLKSGTNGILCKFDIKKTYDYVNWGFLLEVVNKIGWINWCISTPR